MVLYSIIYSVIIHFSHFLHFEHFLQDPLPIYIYPLVYGRGPATAGMAMMPMLLPDGRIGYVLQQSGVPPHTPPPPPQQHRGGGGGRSGSGSGGGGGGGGSSSGGGRRRGGNDSGGRGRSRYNPY
ncbi:hypothetical protein Hanom_Chr14g01324491 [Helianthus anomalus]